MNMKRIVVGLVGLSWLLGGAARGEFVPGHIFVSQVRDTFCHKFQTPDRIWEIDPESGEVSLFLELPECVHLTGLTFTPDGSRLRGAALVPSQILEFDSEGNMAVALDSGDGIVGPEGNNLVYDNDGNFYVVNGSATLMRFPADGGPGTIIADFFDGVRSGAAIDFAADGDLYLGPGGNGGVVESQRFLLRFTAPDWNVSIFDVYDMNSAPVQVSGDRSGYVYVRPSGSVDGVPGTIVRYHAGDADSREFLLSELWGGILPKISPDQTHLYALNGKGGTRVLTIDVRDGRVAVLAEISAFTLTGGGMAVVPNDGAPGDLDLDGDVDLVDFGTFDTCMTGPDVWMDPGCGLCDLDGDSDVDWADVGLFQLAFTGP